MRDGLEAWTGRSEQRQELISAIPIQHLAATLGIDPPASTSGDPVPILWHWLYFLPDAPTSVLGEDGHPRRGLFFPPVKLKRRMFAGGSVTSHGPLRIGESAVHTRRIASIERKDGRSGPLVFVTVDIEVRGSEGPVLSETQTIVYTDAPPGTRGSPIDDGADHRWHSELATDPVLLFRFSALTFNSHRIHYDAAYAREVEGYEGLVVHGPLIALLLAELAHQNGVDVRGFRFRMHAPTLSGSVIHFRGSPTPQGADLIAEVADRGVVARATAVAASEA